MTEAVPPILCVGALTCDLMLHVPRLPQGPGKYLADRVALVAAGMATSAATAIARLGCHVALWASAGEDAIGDFLVAEIGREGIETSHVRRVPGVLSAIASITLDARGERIVVPHYDPALLTAPGSDPFAARDFIGVLVDVRWPAAATHALNAARTAGIPAILDLDVGAPEILAGLVPLASHVVASLDGASVLCPSSSSAHAVMALSAMTDACVIVTEGADGLSWCVPGGDIRSMPAFHVETVDTNAAGDIFHGALAVAITRGLLLEEALRFASAAAAIKCSRYGGRSGAPTRVEVEGFLKARQP
ncbi:PfkB family carbohydrate kinase [Chelatococcus asaccharovorans]|uniref:PfkB family carbohydrate kinase n=1 Tax=Chelatococcus asaccharovorans TaxID=28210 RepID=UPI00224C7B4F|nr:PfkB family carbohydrate kinase [Chelatococcus asaccharovorans]CAH1673663.1 Ribokinase [Chelatococcus asaccharovorans]CAH1674961.1 Ribokinase [Chelatococcus asaccharovorans]